MIIDINKSHLKRALERIELEGESLPCGCLVSTAIQDQYEEYKECSTSFKDLRNGLDLRMWFKGEDDETRCFELGTTCGKVAKLFDDTIRETDPNKKELKLDILHNLLPTRVTITPKEVDFSEK